MIRYRRLFLSTTLLSLCLWATAGIHTESTFLIRKDQVPAPIRNWHPSEVYLKYSGNVGPVGRYQQFFENDVVIKLKDLLDSLQQYRGNVSIGYRLIFKNPSGNIDSLYDQDQNFRINLKGYNKGGTLLKIIEYDSTLKIIDDFVYNYEHKFVGYETPNLTKLIRWYQLFNSDDRNYFAVGNVWMLSIGINDYGSQKYNNCESDASGYLDFFKKEYQKIIGSYASDFFHGYLLLNKNATKDSILNVLKEIISKASFNDYFIFNFTGQSNSFTTDSLNYATYFYPYNVVGRIDSPGNRNTKDTQNVKANLISLKTLQDYIQLIPANNQLFISEAGPSAKFKTEFIKTLMQNSPTISGILNKNRIIIVPNDVGYDDLACQNEDTHKGPINYFITTLDTAYNIFDLFRDNYQATQIAFLLKAKSYSCKAFDFDYFDVFFEKQFLQQYKGILGDEENMTRGVRIKAGKLGEAAGLTGKRYALIVGTDHYDAAEWQKLNNPVYDATAVADELKQDYGFEVTLLKDPAMDTIYSGLRELYQKLGESDQLILYFAGHGDFDASFLDDGFIVCSDSKPIEQDPIRNTYIQYSKLKRMINKMPAREILVMMDICHGGTFDEDILGPKGRENPGEANVTMNVLQFLKDKAQYKTRRLLSSVGNEAAFDGKAGRHSPFANLLLQVLRTRGSGTNGILTLSNLYSVLETASYNEMASLKISPHTARFGDDDALGEFVLIPVQKAGDIQVKIP